MHADLQGGRGPGKQRRLTPLESFVHSNTPLQGRSLFKSKSQDAGDLVNIAIRTHFSLSDKMPFLTEHLGCLLICWL